MENSSEDLSSRTMDRERANDEQVTLSKSLTEDDEYVNLPIDRGWAWVVAFACMMNTTIMIGYLIIMGMLFVEFLKLFQASATSTTLIFGIMAATFGISAFITMQILMVKLSIRQVVMIGGTLVSLGILLSVFAPNIATLICTHSLLVGVGQSMIVGPSVVACSQYFKKRRAFAVSICMSGISLGSILFPLLCRYLLDTYGLRGTLLIFTGIELNLLVTGMLIRPLKIPQTKSTARTTVEDDNISKGIRDQHTTDLSPVLLRQALSDDGEPTIERGHRKDHLRPELRSLSTTLGSMTSLSPPEKMNHKTAKVSVRDLFKSLDFRLLTNPLFHFIVLTFIFGTPIYMYIQYLPAILEEFGTDQNHVPFLLAVNGVMDFISRIVMGFIADLDRIRIPTIMMISILISGLNCHLMKFYQTYATQYICVVIFGIFGNLYGTFMSVLITSMLGLDNLPKAISFLTIIQGIVVPIIHPIIGVLKDSSGTYISSYHFLGAIAVTSGFILLLEPVFLKIDARRKQKLMREEENHNML